MLNKAKILLKSVREYKKPSILTPLFMIGEVVLEVFIPFIMAMLLDKGIAEGSMSNIIIFGSILVVCALLSLGSGVLSAKYGAIASNGFAKNLRKDIYYKVQDYSFKNIDRFSSSSIITRLTTDVTNVQNAYQMILRIAVRAPLMFLFSLIMTFVVNAKIALIFLVIIPCLFGLLIFIAMKAHPYFEKVFRTYDEINNSVKENINGIRVVKSYVQEDYEIEKFEKVSGKIYKLFTRAEKIVCSNSAIMDAFMYTAILLISYLGARCIVGGTLTTGQLTSLFSYSMSILSSLMMLSMIFVMILISLPSMERTVELLTEKNDIVSPENGVTEVKDGSIEFKNVDFSYLNDKKKNALKGINLKIKSGETIGIIGGTGSGKSTLVNLIPRLYDISKGEVLVGGVNVKEYDLEVLRNKVAMVLQKNVLFSGTVKDNLKWGNDKATDKEIKTVCEIAQVSEFIHKLPGGLDYMLDRGGTNVSGGQKQRICIARSLLKNPKVLIFDDSTSACDTKTDAKIRVGLSTYMPDVTKIIIAQRIASVEDADKVIVLDNGKIVDFDTPKKLLKKSKIYKEIYDSQVKGAM